MKLTKEQKQEIADQQSQKNQTKRVTSHELEKILIIEKNHFVFVELINFTFILSMLIYQL